MILSLVVKAMKFSFGKIKKRAEIIPVRRAVFGDPFISSEFCQVLGAVAAA